MEANWEPIRESELGRKLLAIEPNSKAKAKFPVQLVSKGHWDDRPQRMSGDGFIVWALGHANALERIHGATSWSKQ
ncbi:hypothetical protein AWC15_10900 [Mycobacterium lacus]|uniref:Uncharacterized protein n=1 Tax=Mycobacterium lacus TaxID=169765 RepID=A0A1X1XJX1_9MYCO|nr:hypothetical protein AWC15_10900 [Mycobacterium lacus]BBX99005.1 hypothetical protein MLAC_42990 [Mycobacterium lacus]